MRLIRQSTGFALIAAGVASVVVAQPGGVPADGGGSLRALLACRAIEAGPARLACFDRTSAGLADAAEHRDVVVMDRSEVRRARRSLFGLTLPRLPFLGNDGEPGADKGKREAASHEDREDVDSLETVLASAADAPNGYMQLVLQEGGTWRTTDPWSGPSPRTGAKVTVRRGALGNYFIRVGSSRTVRAMRVR